MKPRGGELVRHRDFVRLWSAQTVSQVGSQVSQLALPLVAVIVLHASAFRVALLGTVEMLPFLLFALPAGAWVDRVARRPVLIVADAGRALALGSIPLAAAIGHTTIWQLYAVGFVVGTLASSGPHCSSPASAAASRHGHAHRTANCTGRSSKASVTSSAIHQLGLVFMLGNLGWLGGAVVARRMTERLGVGRTLVLGAALAGAPLHLWPLTPQSAAVPLLVVSTLLVSFGIVLFNIPGISLYQTLVPDRLLGRMNASRRWIVWGVLPLGSLIGGVLATSIGVRATLFVGAGLSTVAFVFLLPKPIRSIATVDGDARAPGDGGLAAPAG